VDRNPRPVGTESRLRRGLATNAAAIGDLGRPRALHSDRCGVVTPVAVKRVYIPKASNPAKLRPLGIPTAAA
jgi:hypothetical protein